MPAAQPSEDFQTHFITHLIDAAAMRTDIENLKRADHDFNTRVLNSLDAVSTELKGLHDLIGLVPRQITACRLDMRNEIERDFPSKMDALNMERRIEESVADTDKTLGKQIAAIDTKLTNELQSVKEEQVRQGNKLDRQWLTITVIVSTVVSIAMIAQWLFTIYGVFKPVIAQ